jgi:hypothetical protein
MPNWKKLIVSGSDASLNSLNVTNNVTAQSFTGSFSGSFTAPGATTQVVYNNGGVLAANSGFVYSGSYVGIGTTTPSLKFNVEDTGATYVAQFKGGNSTYIVSGDTSLAGESGLNARNSVGQLFLGISPSAEAYFSGTSGATALGFYLGGTNALYVNSARNIGIGTTSPGYKLDVVSSNSLIARFNGSAVIASSATEIDILGPQSNGELNIGVGGSTLSDSTNNIQNKGFITAGSGLDGLNLRSDQGYVQITAGGITPANEVARFTATGNVGIGTTSPTAKLEVNGNVKAVSFTGSFSGSVSAPGSTTQIVYNDNGVLAANSGLVYSGSNVGIGISSPTEKLHIVSSAAGNQFGRITATDSNASAAWVAQNDSGDNVVYRVFSSGVSGTQMGAALGRSASLLANLGGSGVFLLGTFSNTNFVLGTNNTENMRITTAGNVGIGTSSPSTILHLSSTSPELSFTATSLNRTSTVGMGDGANFYIKNTSAGNMYISDYNSVYIAYGASSQNVGIGTTSPSAKLQVKGAGATTGITFQTTDSSDNQTFYVLDGGRAGIKYYPFMIAHSSSVTPTGDPYLQVATSTLYVSQSGNVGIGTSSPSQKLHVSAGNFLISGTAIGSGADANSGLRIVAPISTTHYNWMLGAQQNINSAFEITPSTTVGGTTFSTPTAVFLQNGNVGIGNTSPGYKLDVSGIINTTSAPGSYGTIIRVRDTVTSGTESFGGVHFTSSPGTDYTIGKWTTAAGAGLLQIRDQAGIQFVTINSSGNVGIGTSSPGYKLEVVGAVSASTYYGDGSNLTNIGSGSVSAAGSDGQLQYNNSGLFGGASRLYYNDTTNKVGIGTSSPGYDLDVSGSVRVQDRLRVGPINTGNGVIHQSSDATINASSSTIVWSVPGSSGAVAFIEYYIINTVTSTSQRGGNIVVTWNPAGTPQITHTETTTPDIGTTALVTFTTSMALGGDPQLVATNTSINPFYIVLNYRYF